MVRVTYRAKSSPVLARKPPMRLGRYCTGLNQGGQLADVVLGELGRRPLGVGPRRRSAGSPGNDLAARSGRDGAHAEMVLRLPPGRPHRPGQAPGPRLV